MLEALRAAIVARELRPGHPVRQEAVARALGVSAIPVREALRVLEGEGQVVYRPRQGYVVAELRHRDLAEIYRLRQLLEAEAVRRGLPALSDDDVERMDAERVAVAGANAAGAVADAMAANRRLHFTLFTAAGMPFLLRHIRMLWDATAAYRALYNNDPRWRAGIDREHREIMAAVRARDPDRTIALLDAHRDHALETLAGILGDGAEEESGAPSSAGAASA